MQSESSRRAGDSTPYLTRLWPIGPQDAPTAPSYREISLTVVHSCLFSIQNPMGCTKTLGAGFILLLFSRVGVRGQVLYSDGFEGYNNGALDANLSGGPNQGPNGGPGNPWFGPAPPNLQVVGTVGGVNPHSGIKMVTAAAPGDFDQDWLNISARFNAGNPYLGNMSLDWWFYDPTGAGNSNFRDYAALGYYNSANGTGGLDYPASSGGNLNPGGALQRLSLGASNPTGFNNTKYQARVVG